MGDPEFSSRFRSIITVPLADALPAEVLANTDAGIVDSSTLTSGGVEYVAFYFCGRWCAPAADFTVRLRQYYDAVKKAAAEGKASTMEVVLVPCDRYDDAASITDIVAGR